MLYRNSTLSAEGDIPSLSIITVVYNARLDFEKTLASVSDQKQRCVEYIVIDGASSDGTLESAQRGAAVIDLLLTEPDKGIYDAMNKGILLARGKALLFLNAGDTLVSGAVTQLLRSSLSNSDLVCHAVQICHAGLAIGIYPAEAPPENPDFQHMYWPHPGILARRTAFDLIGNFDASLRYSADLDWINRVMHERSLRISYCNHPIVNFDLGGASSTAESASESRKVAIRHGKSPLLAWWRYLKIRIRQIGMPLSSIIGRMNG